MLARVIMYNAEGHDVAGSLWGVMMIRSIGFLC